MTRARRKVFEEFHDKSSTWGAYQCYGDHSFRLRPQPSGQGNGRASARTYVFSSAREAVVELENVSADADTASHSNARTLKDKLGAIEKALEGNHAWMTTRADLRAALGTAHGQLLNLGSAVKHLTEALRQEPATLPMQSAELLANLTARHAFLEFVDNHISVSDAEAGIREAIGRIDDLINLGRTSERMSLRGSAYKRWAAIVQGDQRDANLREAYQAYRDAFDIAQSHGETNLYPLYNLLSTMALLRTRGLDAVQPDRFSELLARARKQADEKERHDPSFFSLISMVELRIVERMWEGALSEEDAREISEKYVAAWQRGGSVRSLSSITEHLVCCARILAPEKEAVNDRERREQLNLALEKTIEGLRRLRTPGATDSAAT